MKKILPHLWEIGLVGVLVAGVGVGINLTQRQTNNPAKAAGESVRIYLDPGQALDTNSKIYRLMLDAKTNQIGAVRVIFTFDKTRLKLIKEMKTGWGLKMNLTQTTYEEANSTGEFVAVFGVAVSDKEKAPTGVIELAELTFGKGEQYTDKSGIYFSTTESRVANMVPEYLPVTVTNSDIILGDVAVAPTAGPANLSFEAVEDATIWEAYPSKNGGNSNIVSVDGSPVKAALLKFNINGIGGRTVRVAKLRLYCLNAAGVSGGKFYGTTTNWNEADVTWSMAPAGFDYLGSIGKTVTNMWYEVNVTPYIKDDGTYAFRMMSSSTDGADYSSSEGSYKPQLILSLD